VAKKNWIGVYGLVGLQVYRFDKVRSKDRILSFSGPTLAAKQAIGLSICRVTSYTHVTTN